MRHTGFLVSTTIVFLATLASAGAQDSHKQRPPDVERSVAPDGLLSEQEVRLRAAELKAGEDRETVTRKRLARELMSREPDVTGSIQRSSSTMRSAVAVSPPVRTILE